MRVFKVLEHEGQLFMCGDRVKAVFDNDKEIRGTIEYYDEYWIDGKLQDAVEIGEYCVPLSEIKSISKI